MSTNIRLIHGDCIEEMQKLAEEGVVFDLVLTDPPYGVMAGLSLDTQPDGAHDWDVALDVDDMMQGVGLLVRQNAMVVLFSQEPLTSQLRIRQYNNIVFRYPCIWLKNHYANHLGARKNCLSYYEDINVMQVMHDNQLRHPIRPYAKEVLQHTKLSCKDVNARMGDRSAEHFLRHDTSQISKPSRKCYERMIELFGLDKMEGFKPYEDIYEMCRAYDVGIKRVFNLPDGAKYKSNVFEYPKESKRYHPTQKPVALLEDLIKTYSNEGDTVLDFTMGSGSTGVACINTGRNFIGIEKDDKYFDVATQRIAERLKNS